MVTDGSICINTNERGEYSFQSVNKDGFVYISIPAGYVCALHEQSAPAASNRKISKLQIILVKLCLKQVYFSRGCKSLMHGVVPEALASRKLVVGDDSSEGSETAKSGTDEQKRYMRHNCLG